MINDFMAVFPEENDTIYKIAWRCNYILKLKTKNIDSFLCGGQARFLTNEIKGLDDFELLCALIKYGKNCSFGW